MGFRYICKFWQPKPSPLDWAQRCSRWRNLSMARWHTIFVSKLGCWSTNWRRRLRLCSHRIHQHGQHHASNLERSWKQSRIFPCIRSSWSRPWRRFLTTLWWIWWPHCCRPWWRTFNKWFAQHWSHHQSEQSWRYTIYYNERRLWMGYVSIRWIHRLCLRIQSFKASSLKHKHYGGLLAYHRGIHHWRRWGRIHNWWRSCR